MDATCVNRIRRSRHWLAWREYCERAVAVCTYSDFQPARIAVERTTKINLGREQTVGNTCGNVGGSAPDLRRATGIGPDAKREIVNAIYEVRPALQSSLVGECRTLGVETFCCTKQARENKQYNKIAFHLLKHCHGKIRPNIGLNCNSIGAKSMNIVV